MKRKACLPACVCCAVLLCACARNPARTDPTPTPEMPAATAQPAAVPVPDGLEGGYYNDFLGETLTLDGFGSCCLADAQGVCAGTYLLREGGVLLMLPEGAVAAELTAEGDFCLEGRTGRYLGNWAFWGIPAEQANLRATQEIPEEETFSAGPGVLRHRDLKNAVAFSFDETLILLPRRGDAAAVTDGCGGFVSVRNVTSARRSFAPDGFLEECVRTYVFSDFERFYGEHPGAYESLSLAEGANGCGNAALTLLGGSGAGAEVRAALCRADYDDGTENVLLITVMAPDEQQEQAMRARVFDISAARVAESGE
ncbi:MAG: hypothetical protein E7472_01650 [Ruminococcaceae bacterium]|nr:hypothetical protein [Oscillospiraceae bacterium]